MKLIDKLPDIEKATLAQCFESTRNAARELGGGKAEMTVTFGEDSDHTHTFEGFEGKECSLTFTVKPANGT